MKLSDFLPLGSSLTEKAVWCIGILTLIGIGCGWWYILSRRKP